MNTVEILAAIGTAVGTGVAAYAARAAVRGGAAAANANEATVDVGKAVVKLESAIGLLHDVINDTRDAVTDTARDAAAALGKVEERLERLERRAGIRNHSPAAGTPAPPSAPTFLSERYPQPSKRK